MDCGFTAYNLLGPVSPLSDRFSTHLPKLTLNKSLPTGMEKGETLLAAKAERVGRERTGKGKGGLVSMRNEEGSYTTGKHMGEEGR